MLSIIILTLSLSTKGIVTMVSRLTSVLPNFSNSEDQLICKMCKNKCLVMCIQFFCRVPLIVKSQELLVTAISFTGTNCFVSIKHMHIYCSLSWFHCFDFLKYQPIAILKIHPIIRYTGQFKSDAWYV